MHAGAGENGLLGSALASKPMFTAYGLQYNGPQGAQRPGSPGLVRPATSSLAGYRARSQSPYHSAGGAAPSSASATPRPSSSIPYPRPAAGAEGGS